MKLLVSKIVSLERNIYLLITSFVYAKWCIESQMYSPTCIGRDLKLWCMMIYRCRRWVFCWKISSKASFTTRTWCIKGKTTDSWFLYYSSRLQGWLCGALSEFPETNNGTFRFPKRTPLDYWSIKFIEDGFLWEARINTWSCWFNRFSRLTQKIPNAAVRKLSWIALRSVLLLHNCNCCL